MRYQTSCQIAAVRRRGTVVALLAMTIVLLVAFLALSIDLGMLAVAKTQAQNAADLAALTAARTLNGDPSSTYNNAAATTNAQNILTYNVILGQSIQSSQLALSYGSYDYNQSTQTFGANFPATTGVPYTAVSATVTANNMNAAFSKVFGAQFLPTVTATATAVHRPRDIALVMDLSGSMRFGTCLGYDFFTNSRTSNNPDTLYPTFGHYSSNNANMQGPTKNQTSSFDNYTISPSQYTTPNNSYSLIFLNNFYQNAAYASTIIRAFDSYSTTDNGKTWVKPTTQRPQLPPNSYATTPGGDVPAFVKGSTTNYAQEVEDVCNGSGNNARNQWWELDGYSGCVSGSFQNADLGTSNYASAPFNGYTQGPGYYGKTFFIWPPDPRRPLSTANNAATIKQFLLDFGYTNSDFSGATTGPPLSGIYNATSTSGSRTWPWPNDGGTSLGTYLTGNVYLPGGSRKLLTTDPQYQRIMRLYNWNYVVDNVGTTPCDWRVRFFGTNNNQVLFNGSGTLNAPGSYSINYNEILRWIASSADPFPTQMRAGRIKYYGSIPTSITGTWPNWGGTDQRFWVEYINYVLGFYQTGANSYQDVSAMAGYGSDFTWGTVNISAPPSATQYMGYTDNPLRPRLRFWFGPLTMGDFLQNYNMYENVGNYFFMQPADSYEAPLYTGKQAYLAAITTMENNHPNDWFTLSFYSWPRTSASDTTGRLNGVACPLGTNYAYAQSALLFPFSTINADGSCNNTEVTPYDPDQATNNVPSANFLDTPRADGDTSFAMSLMQCYNQFAVTSPTDPTLRNFATATPIAFPTGMAGGMGRKSAQKVIIFETDGLANCDATATLVTNGTYKYYKIRYDMNRPFSSEYPSINATNINDPTVLSHIYSLIDQLAADYGTTRNPFRLYALGFGPVFQGTDASGALSTLQTMQYHAGTQSSASTALPANQIITGTDTQMSANMVAAFTSILQNGVQVALFK
jgi:Flp pilus assembly protein TadG